MLEMLNRKSEARNSQEVQIQKVKSMQCFKQEKPNRRFAFSEFGIYFAAPCFGFRIWRFEFIFMRLI